MYTITLSLKFKKRNTPGNLNFLGEKEGMQAAWDLRLILINAELIHSLILPKKKTLNIKS